MSALRPAIDPWGSDPDRTTRHWQPGEFPPYPCDICGMAIEAGEKFTHDPKGETTHNDCARGWFRGNFGREGLS